MEEEYGRKNAGEKMRGKRLGGGRRKRRWRIEHERTKDTVSKEDEDKVDKRREKINRTKRCSR